MGIILAYDCTSEDSFNNVRNWVRQIEVHASSNVEKILIGNKADLTDKKVIDYEQGASLAKEFGMQFYETSARTGHNVNETFFYISKQIKDKQQKAQSLQAAPGQSNNGKTQNGNTKIGGSSDNTTRGSTLQEGGKKKKKSGECCKWPPLMHKSNIVLYNSIHKYLPLLEIPIWTISQHKSHSSAT